MFRKISALLALIFVLTTGAGAVEPEDKNPILGPPTTTVSQMQSWARSKGADAEFIELAEVFYNVSVKWGVDPAVTYTQSAKETNFFKFTGVLNKTFKNPCGLKTTQGGGNYDPAAHKTFSSWEEGITAQVHHLALYAGHEDFPKADTPDPRHFASIYGVAPNVEDLGGRWAPSSSYGTDIVRMMKELWATNADGKPVIPAPVTPDPVKPDPTPVKPTPVEPAPIDKGLVPIGANGILPDRSMLRIYGGNRIETAVKVSQTLTVGADQVILANGETYVDALVASLLTYDPENGTYAPILLNTGKRLDPMVRAEILRLGAGSVLAVGGATHIPDQVLAELRSISGVEVTRIAGQSRYATANLIAERLGASKEYILVNGINNADALAIAPYSATKNLPILLTDGKTLDSATKAKLEGSQKVIIIGGTGSVSANIESDLKSKGITVHRIAGSNRFATAVEVAKKLYPNTRVFTVSNGKSLADALVGAPLAAKYAAPILLSDAAALTKVTGDYISSKNPLNIVVLGGSGSIGASAFLQLESNFD